MTDIITAISILVGSILGAIILFTTIGLLIKYICHSRCVGCQWCRYSITYVDGGMDCNQRGFVPEPVPSSQVCLGFIRKGDRSD